MDIENLKDTIQDCHLNFLIGSGLSRPFLPTLGNIEILLTELQKNKSIKASDSKIIYASIISKYFEGVILKNREILADSISGELKEVKTNYYDFLKYINEIMLERKSSLFNKQVNIFTTNIDIFFEKVFDKNEFEFNDGFSGTFSPSFKLSNFKKSFIKNSLHFDNTSEIPAFNLYKVHGSLTWKIENNKVMFNDLTNLKEIENEWDIIKGNIIKYDDKSDLKYFIDNLGAITKAASYDNFIDAYGKLAIVNPTKEKFKDTTLNLNYYELLRTFSNELEKDNSLLFILGFSLADEHIKEILLRAANSNPTLIIKIFAHSEGASKEIMKNLYGADSNALSKYSNIDTLTPATGSNFGFKEINSEFEKLLTGIKK